MSHSLVRGATSREMDVIAKLTTAEERAGESMIRSALGAGLELIRELIEDRGRRHDFDDQADAPHDDFQWEQSPSDD